MGGCLCRLRSGLTFVDMAMAGVGNQLMSSCRYRCLWGADVLMVDRESALRPSEESPKTASALCLLPFRVLIEALLTREIHESLVRKVFHGLNRYNLLLYASYRGFLRTPHPWRFREPCEILAYAHIDCDASSLPQPVCPVNIELPRLPRLGPKDNVTTALHMVSRATRRQTIMVNGLR